MCNDYGEHGRFRNAWRDAPAALEAKMSKTTKTFDCIRMKRRIQERIFEETRAMTAEQRQRHTLEKIRRSRFASFLD